MNKIVLPISELTEKEVNVLFSGFAEGCKQNILLDKELTASLIDKGYFSDGVNPDLTFDGKQNIDKYWYECCEVILEEIQKSNDMNDIFANVSNEVNISKYMFNIFIDNLVSIGKITEISKYIK